MNRPRRDLGAYANRFNRSQKLARVFWNLVAFTLYRFSPRPCHGWRRFLLRCFGATIGAGAKPYRGAVIWAPWNLILGERCWLADGVDCYSVAPITIGDDVVISQRAVLCAASHDYRSPLFPLVAKPIVIGRGAWVAAEAFIGPGVTIGEGGVVAARACVMRNVEAWTVVAGNPATLVKHYSLDEPKTPTENEVLANGRKE